MITTQPPTSSARTASAASDTWPPAVGELRDHGVAAQLLRRVEFTLRCWEEYEANLRLPADQRRALPEPRISAASLRWLRATLRPPTTEPARESAAQRGPAGPSRRGARAA